MGKPKCSSIARTPRPALANTSKSNVLFSNPAPSTRGVLSFIRSFLAAASLPALASSAGGNTALPEGQVCAGEQCSTDYTARTYRLLSLVGPILSLEESQSAAQGGGPPYHGQDWRSFDVRSGKAAHPLDLLEPKSLERALRADPVVRERLGRALTSLRGAREILEKLLPKRGLQGFAFQEYDRKKKQVALRIAFHPDVAGLAPNEISQIGLWVSPQAEARRYFEQAAAGEGFFLGTRSVERRLIVSPK